MFSMSETHSIASPVTPSGNSISPSHPRAKIAPSGVEGQFPHKYFLDLSTSLYPHCHLLLQTAIITCLDHNRSPPFTAPPTSMHAPCIYSSLVSGEGPFQNINFGVSIVAQWKRIQLGTMKLCVRSLASISGLRIRCCHELWCRSQMQLEYGIAVA